MGTVPPAESPLFLVHEKMWNVFQSVPIEERLRQVRCFIIHMKIPRAIMHRICRLPSRDESRNVTFVEFRDFLEGKKRMKECHEAKVFTTYLNMKYSPKAVVAYVKKFKFDANYFKNFKEGVPQNAKCPSEGVLGASCTCHHSYIKVKKFL
ncbi:hypothetical protein CAEBREN_17395 [Caenorhabditis brenneri]|uniref:Uncharacterized protein n=1 Tax=Caenorhabditis brenneri TaxID=135651 RepID=G0MYA5_CAEBE|nr:hypothetical protein CAEBREN_17395 [Caenorhabditis brenneri]